MQGSDKNILLVLTVPAVVMPFLSKLSTRTKSLKNESHPVLQPVFKEGSCQINGHVEAKIYLSGLTKWIAEVGGFGKPQDVYSKPVRFAVQILQKVAKARVQVVHQL